MDGAAGGVTKPASPARRVFKNIVQVMTPEILRQVRNRKKEAAAAAASTSANTVAAASSSINTSSGSSSASSNVGQRLAHADTQASRARAAAAAAASSAAPKPSASHSTKLQITKPVGPNFATDRRQQQRLLTQQSQQQQLQQQPVKPNALDKASFQKMLRNYQQDTVRRTTVLDRFH